MPAVAVSLTLRTVPELYRCLSVAATTASNGLTRAGVPLPDEPVEGVVVPEPEAVQAVRIPVPAAPSPASSRERRGIAFMGCGSSFSLQCAGAGAALVVVGPSGPSHVGCGPVGIGSGDARRNALVPLSRLMTPAGQMYWTVCPAGEQSKRPSWAEPTACASSGTAPVALAYRETRASACVTCRASKA
jgi:hypothetical protein